MSTETSWADRPPPHNAEAEAAVLGACLIDRTALVQVKAVLAPADFYILAHQRIFEAVLKVAAAGETVDLITVSAAVTDDEPFQRTGKYSYLGSLANQVTITSHVEAHAQIVARMAARRRVIQQARKVIDEAHQDEGNLENVLSATSQFSQVLGSKSGLGLRKLDFSRWLQERKASLGVEEPFIPTGFSDLDDAVPLIPGELTLLLGSSGDGKSTMAVRILINIAKGRGRQRAGGRAVALYSLEMSDTQIYQKLLAEEGNLDILDMRTLSMDEMGWITADTAAKRLDALPLYVNVSGDVTLDTMRQEVMQLKLQCPDLSLVVIDYLGITADQQGRQERHDLMLIRLAYLCKRMAKELGVHVIALAQAPVDKDSSKFSGCLNPSKADIKNAKGIQDAADNMIHLLRPSRFTNPNAYVAIGGREIPSTDKLLTNVLLCFITKARLGPEHPIPLYWRKGTGKIGNLATPWPWEHGAEEPKPAADAPVVQLPPPDPYAKTGLE